MIARISGRIHDKTENGFVVGTGSIFYDVLVPLAVMNAMEEETTVGSEVELVVYHYYQMEPSRAVPVLIGFQNDIEKEFFEKFISVSGVGPKAACKALTEPFSMIAGAIDAGDVSFLKKLPGIGEQRARLIIAKLQGKVGKYGLIRDKALLGRMAQHEDIRKEAAEVLLQLQYRKSEADNMIEKALRNNPDIKTSEELLNEVYRERRSEA